MSASRPEVWRKRNLREPDFPRLLTGTNSSPIRNVRYFGSALYMLIVDLAEDLRRRKLLQRTFAYETLLNRIQTAEWSIEELSLAGTGDSMTFTGKKPRQSFTNLSTVLYTLTY
jgi:hypothetical protein